MSTPTITILGIEDLIDQHNQQALINGLGEIPQIGAFKKNVEKAVVSAINDSTLTRGQRILLARMKDMEPDTITAIQKKKIKFFDKELSLSRHVATSGTTVTKQGSFVNLLAEDSTQQDGVTTFQENHLPNGQTALITAIGIEVGATTGAAIAATFSTITVADPKAAALLCYDSTRLIYTPIATDAVANPVRSYLLPEILLNSIIEFRFGDEIVYQEAIRNLTSNGGTYSATKGLFDVKPLSKPLLLNNKQNLEITIKYPVLGVWPQIDTTPTGAFATMANAEFFVRVRMQSSMLQIKNS